MYTGQASLLGVPRSLVAMGACVGLVVGALYALSPLTFWVCGLMAAVLMAVSRGLSAAERRWVLTLLMAALVVRVLLLAWLVLTTDHNEVFLASFPFDGDGRVMKMRSFWIRNVWLDVPLDKKALETIFDDYGWTSYLYVLAYVQYLLGPAPYGVHLLNAALYMTGAVMLYRLTRRAYGAIAAWIGLAVVAFWPTDLFWSVSALKESLQFFLAALAVTAGVAVVRGSGWTSRAAAAFVFVVVAAAMNTVRPGALLMACGIGGSLALGGIGRRPLLLATAVIGAAIALVYAARLPGIQTRVMDQIQLSALIHHGNVRTPGHGYKLLDERFYPALVRFNEITPPMTSAEAARFATRALASFVVIPLPWQAQSASELAFIPEQLAWYCLVVLAPIGLLGGLRRDPLVTLGLVGYVVVGVPIIALNNGNIGSMVRLRDLLVPFIASISALGAVETLRFAVVHSTAKSSSSVGYGEALCQ